MKFKLPKTLKFGGMTFKIITDPKLKESDCWAQYRPLVQQIAMSPEANQIGSFLHEIVHGIADKMISTKEYQDEEMAQRIAVMVRAFIADNPAFVRHLADVLGAEAKRHRP